MFNMKGEDSTLGAKKVLDYAIISLFTFLIAYFSGIKAAKFYPENAIEMLILAVAMGGLALAVNLMHGNKDYVMFGFKKALKVFSYAIIPVVLFQTYLLIGEKFLENGAVMNEFCGGVVVTTLYALTSFVCFTHIAFIFILLREKNVKPYFDRLFEVRARSFESKIYFFLKGRKTVSVR